MNDERSDHQIEAALARKINLALYQNSVPILRELIVINKTNDPLKSLKLTFYSEPGFIKLKIWRIDEIAEGQCYNLTDLDVVLDGALLTRLTEAVTAKAIFVLNTGVEEVARLELSIELLPKNQWGGIGNMPEMIAAFVQPNESAIEHLLKKTAEILRKHGKNAALNGYEQGPKRVWEMCSAIWGAVGAMGLEYAMPPASFECTGQKIRSPGQIADNGIATCIDIALTFCAAVEQCGLNPLIVFVRDHALVGVWLRPVEFTTIVVDDITALRKRLKLKELILFETTLITQRPCPGFRRALELGARHISEDEEERFELAVDIRRARVQKIKPLASEQAMLPPVGIPESRQDLEPEFEIAPDLPNDEPDLFEEPEVAKPKDRLDSWQRHLLDLSLRNRLLNFKSTKKAIKLYAPDPGRIEDMLANGDTLKLHSHPNLMDGPDLRSQRIHESRTNEDLRGSHALDALRRKEVFVTLTKDELDSRLTELFRFARVSLQEGGANTLFLALGFLSWTRDNNAEKRFRAPLILVPVKLIRKSIRSGFGLRLHEEESRFNPTLIEMLRQDFSLELPVVQGELPKDNHGLDVTGIWRSVAQSIKDIRGWEVVEDVVLSTFSFAKFLMWKDLVDRTDQLKQNSVIKHLLETPRDPYDSSGEFPDPHTLDQSYGPEKVFCPCSADSSQLSAVIAAAAGKDFVLIGPPGTGKSQTIVNLIAQCLADNKTVLFTSEKIAALNVVYRRLSEVGLGDFCLELHSNKARKRDVLKQLGNAWGAKGGIDAKEWGKKAQRLKGLRDQLNDFVEHLHKRHQNGLTAYIAMGRVVTRADVPTLGLSWPLADTHRVDELFALENLADELDINAREVGSITKNPLTLLCHSEWSPTWQQSLIASVQELLASAQKLKKGGDAFLKAAGLPEFPLDDNGRTGLSTLSQILSSAAGRDWRFSLRPDVRSVNEELRNGLQLLGLYRETKAKLPTPWGDDLIHKIKHGLELIERHQEISDQLSAPYADQATDLDVRQLKIDWDKAEKSWWPLSILRRRRVRRVLESVTGGQQELDISADMDRLLILRDLGSDLRTLDDLSQDTSGLWIGLNTSREKISSALALQAVIPLALDDENWTEKGLREVAAGECGTEMKVDLENLKNLQSLKKKIADFHLLKEKTNGLWTGLNTRVEEVEKALAFQESLSSVIARIAPTAESTSAFKVPLERLLGDGNSLLEPSGAVTGAGSIYVDAVAHFQAAHSALVEAAGTISSEFGAIAGDTPDLIAESCRSILRLKPKFRAWCAWRKVRGKALTHGLGPLVEGIENGTVPQGEVRDFFKVDYARWWLNRVVDNDEVLRNFVSATHDKYINDFQVLDDRFTELTRDYVRAGLCANLPDQETSGKNSEWGILRHEMQKKKRHLALRDLIKRIPNVVTRLAPCMLMSPLSIAQYFAAELTPFDLVVFDEASQIPVWDAIGAIARGKQVVMVGDPKQLPPTSFYDRAESDIDYQDVEGDLESILDECLASNLPALNLSWHYRSHHESLISFSNYHYYDGRLVTFPSPVTEDSAVSFHYVENGIYERGKTRTNKPEAREVVKHILSQLNDPNFAASKRTIGVVTFNAEQQRLIEDLLDVERRKNPSIEPYFSDDVIEPIFVKNLETVQGDERDIMYFSITFGPDIARKILMTFGPMTKAGGERRLNVAITRARHKLLVFSSLKPDQIDLSRTQADGVRDLKHFMEFADRGPKAIAEAISGSIGDYESPFEQAVAEALANKGWQAHPQIGVSSFRIDLGVVDPDAPGRYLAGIECDGATYHRSATARDRDKLREQVLCGLGWQILRIWSTDWWVDAVGALEKVHTKLVSLLEESRAIREEEERKREAALKTSTIQNSNEFAEKDTGSAGEEFELIPSETEPVPTVNTPSPIIQDSTAKPVPLPESSNNNSVVLRYFNLYASGIYIMTENEPLNADFVIPIESNQRNGYLLQCYRSGHINKVLISVLLSRKIGKEYMNGLNKSGELIDLKIIESEEIIGIFFMEKSRKKFKAHLTENISMREQLHLQGYKVMYNDFDRIEYKVLPLEILNDISRLVFQSFAANGKALDNKYYEHEWTTIRRFRSSRR